MNRRGFLRGGIISAAIFRIIDLMDSQCFLKGDVFRVRITRWSGAQQDQEGD